MAPRGKSSTLSIVIAGDNKGAKKAMQDTETQTKSLGKNVAGLAAGFGAMLAGGAIVRWAKQTIDAYRDVGGEMMALKRITGTSEEFASGLWVGAQQSGIAIDKMSTSLSILQGKIASGAIDKLGVQTKDAAGETRAFDQILGDLMDKYGELADQDKAGFARSLFGRGGADMMKFLGKGREELDRFIDRARELGITLNAADISEATKNQRDFQLALTASKVVIGKELLPAVTEMTGHLADNMPAIAQVVGGMAAAFNALPKPLQAAAAATLAFGPAIRLASVAVGPLTAGVGALVRNGALDSFRLGLMGVTSSGAGASNMLGGLLSRVSMSPALMAGAAVGVGVLTIALIEMADGANRANENAKNLVATAEATGKSLEQVFNEQLAKTFAGADGAFDIGDSGQIFRDTMQGMGVDAGELADALDGTDAQFAEFKDQVADFLIGQGQETFIGPMNDDLDTLRGSSQRAAEQQRILNEANRDLGVGTDEATKATEDNTAATYRNVAAQESVADAISRRRSALESVISAERSSESANEALWNATVDLADAERAAAGNSEEMAAALESEKDAAEAVVDAREAHQDALEGIGEAEEGVADAQRGVLDAQENLNQAREDAAEKIRDMAEAAREAVLDEEGANLAVLRAKRELDDFLRSPQATDDLKRQELELALREAQEALRQAQGNTQETAADAAAAAAAGVEGSQEVQDAQRQLADAHESVREAQDRVTDAKERARDAADAVTEAEKRQADAARDTAKVGEEAEKRLTEAKKAHEEAVLAAVEAQAGVTTAMYGTEAGTRAWQTALRDLAADLDPDSPLRQRINDLIRDLSLVLSGGIGPGGAYGSPDAADRPRSGGSGGPSGIPQDESRDPVRSGRRGAPVIVNQYLNGSAAHERRLLKQQGEDLANSLAGSIG